MTRRFALFSVNEKHPLYGTTCPLEQSALLRLRGFQFWGTAGTEEHSLPADPDLLNPSSQLKLGLE